MRLVPPLTLPTLSPRERQVCAVAATLSDAEVAFAVGITIRTAKETLKHARLKYKDYLNRQAMVAMKFAPEPGYRSVVR
jgi:DNA-directed RNA polymerase specialized sigma24 family protein